MMFVRRDRRREDSSGHVYWFLVRFARGAPARDTILSTDSY